MPPTPKKTCLGVQSQIHQRLFRAPEQASPQLCSARAGATPLHVACHAEAARALLAAKAEAPSEAAEALGLAKSEEIRWLWPKERRDWHLWDGGCKGGTQVTFSLETRQFRWSF